MKTKFTPAPWTADESRVYFSDNKGGFDIRDCLSPIANAHLIAAAPEMYESLIIAIGSIKEICDVREIPLPNSVIRRSEAALAKARGKP